MHLKLLEFNIACVCVRGFVFVDILGVCVCVCACVRACMCALCSQAFRKTLSTSDSQRKPIKEACL